MEDLADPIGTFAVLVIIIFVTPFVTLLFYFTWIDLYERMSKAIKRRRYAKSIIDNAVARFVEHH